MTPRRFISAATAMAIFAAALTVLYRSVHVMTLADVAGALGDTAPAALIGSVVATAVSFAMLGYYDHFATRLVAPGRVAARHAYYVGSVSHAISNTLGFHVVTGVAVRYRLYVGAGLGAVDTARVTAIVGFCVALGSVAMLVLALLVTPPAFEWGRVVGLAGVVVLALVFVAFPALTRTLRLRQIDLARLRRRALVTPLLAGMLEAGAAIMAFYLLLPADLAPSFVSLALIVMAAVVLGVLSHAPGGVGVFEAAVLASFPAARHVDVLAALMLYRLIYNLLPCAVASIALGCSGFLRRPVPTVDGKGAVAP